MKFCDWNEIFVDGKNSYDDFSLLWVAISLDYEKQFFSWNFVIRFDGHERVCVCHGWAMIVKPAVMDSKFTTARIGCWICFTFCFLYVRVYTHHTSLGRISVGISALVEIKPLFSLNGILIRVFNFYFSLNSEFSYNYFLKSVTFRWKKKIHSGWAISADWAFISFL